MAWQDRTRPAAYTAPSGRRFAFDFESADRAFDKNTSAYNFPGVRGTYVQDLGGTDRRYPMRVVFWGDDHDRQASDFEAALRETGRGRLEHPRDGRVDVVPFGTVTVREDLVRNANQTVFEVEFWESTSVLFPSGASDPRQLTLNSADGAFAAAVATFVNSVDLSVPSSVVTLRNNLADQVARVERLMGPVVSADPKIARQFKNVIDGINSALPNVATDAGAIAAQAAVLLDLPSGAKADVTDKLNAYAGISGEVSRSTEGGNAFRSAELFAMGAVAGSVKAAVISDYRTRPAAIAAATSVSDQFATVNAWRESNYG